MPKTTKGDNTNKPNVLGDPKMIPAQKINGEIERLDQLMQDDIKRMKALEAEYNKTEVRIISTKNAIKILQDLFLDDADNQA